MPGMSKATILLKSEPLSITFRRARTIKKMTVRAKACYAFFIDVRSPVILLTVAFNQKNRI